MRERFCSTPLAIRTPNAIGRSKAEPSLRMSAGARLTVILRLGNSKPELRSADFIRSKASRTAPSASPTMRKLGTPALISSSTSTAKASTPESALESTLASKFRPFEPHRGSTQAIKLLAVEQYCRMERKGIAVMRQRGKAVETQSQEQLKPLKGFKLP